MKEASSISAHDLVSPTLRARIATVRKASARLTATEQDEDALHDFRVALRRLRSVLRPLRDVYGKRSLGDLSADLKRVSDATGALRDEEVLRETMRDLPLDPKTRTVVDAWLWGRKHTEERDRRAFVKTLVSKGKPSRLERSLDQLERLLAKRDARFGSDEPSAEALAKIALERAFAEVDASQGARDAEGLHRLRICFKRLRYVIELLRPILGDDAETIARGATKMQRRLGELHDLDEALGQASRAEVLSVGVRATAVQALEEARARSERKATQALPEVLASFGGEGS